MSIVLIPQLEKKMLEDFIKKDQENCEALKQHMNGLELLLAEKIQQLSDMKSAMAEKDSELLSVQENCSSLQTQLGVSERLHQAFIVSNMN